MSGFALDWLTLREPADHAARNRVIAGRVAAAFSDQQAPKIVDLGAGSGSTMRALAPHLPSGQSWLLVDNDAALLAAIEPDQPGRAFTTKTLDLATEFEEALAGTPDLVTTSALLDLVSANWFSALVSALAAQRLPFYAALTYTGHMAFEPAHPLDGAIVDLFNQHQGGDKGFGPALGPSAGDVASERLRLEGAIVTTGHSDWRLEPADGPLQSAVLEGVVGAVRETRGMPDGDLDAWSSHRSAAIDADRATMQVGHIDIFSRF